MTAVNLSLAPGEFVTLCGKSGSGKSTLLRLLKPSVSPVGRLSGVRLFEGDPLETVNVRTEAQKIGFIGQNPSDCVVTDTVWHELAFGLESLGEPTEKIRARVAEIASYFGIADWFRKSTNTLSGGEEQLLCLASVMVMQPTRYCWTNRPPSLIRLPRTVFCRAFRASAASLAQRCFERTSVGGGSSCCPTVCLSWKTAVFWPTVRRKRLPKRCAVGITKCLPPCRHRHAQPCLSAIQRTLVRSPCAKGGFGWKSSACP